MYVFVKLYIVITSRCTVYLYGLYEDTLKFHTFAPDNMVK